MDLTHEEIAHVMTLATLAGGLLDGQTTIEEARLEIVTEYGPDFMDRSFALCDTIATRWEKEMGVTHGS